MSEKKKPVPVPLPTSGAPPSEDELKFGDNDKLSALVASLLPADLLDMINRHAGTSKARLPAQVSAWIEERLSVNAEPRDAEWSADEVYVGLPIPGGDAWLRIGRIDSIVMTPDIAADFIQKKRPIKVVGAGIWYTRFQTPQAQENTNAGFDVQASASGSSSASVGWAPSPLEGKGSALRSR